MERSIEIVKRNIKRLANDVCDDCIGIAKCNDIEPWFAIEEFQKIFNKRIKEYENRSR